MGGVNKNLKKVDVSYPGERRVQETKVGAAAKEAEPSWKAMGAHVHSSRRKAAAVWRQTHRFALKKNFIHFFQSRRFHHLCITRFKTFWPCDIK